MEFLSFLFSSSSLSSSSSSPLSLSLTRAMRVTLLGCAEGLVRTRRKASEAPLQLTSQGTWWTSPTLPRTNWWTVHLPSFCCCCNVFFFVFFCFFLVCVIWEYIQFLFFFLFFILFFFLIFRNWNFSSQIFPNRFDVIIIIPKTQIFSRHQQTHYPVSGPWWLIYLRLRLLWCLDHISFASFSPSALLFKSPQ